MKVKFLPQNIEVEVNPNKTLLQMASENNIEIKSVCKGVPSCAECRVKIASGEHNVIPPTKAELALIGTSHYIDSRRLSCQVRCFGDVTVDLTEQIEKAENQTKKVRGFRTAKNMESKAVQDTMILNEKIDVQSAPSPSASDVNSSNQQTSSNSSQQQGQQRPQHKQQNNHNRNNNQQKSQNQNQQQAKNQNQQKPQHQHNKNQNQQKQQQNKPQQQNSNKNQNQQKPGPKS